MCRSTHYQSNSHGHVDGDPFTITAFFIRLRGSGFEFIPYESASNKPSPIPDSLTLLLYLPLGSSSNNTLKIEGSSTNNKIPLPPQYSSPATVSLRRLRLATDANGHGDGDVIFGSKQRVRATTQVLSFQLYFGEAKLLKGALKKEDYHHHHHLWKLECCTCELHSSISISEVELWVALDGLVAISERVAIPTPKKPMPMPMALGVNKYNMRNNKHRINKLKLEDIPEETELRIDTDIDCDVNDPESNEASIHLEMDLEGLRQAVDMGIWVLCLGFAVGYMVSRGSITKFRRPPTFY